MTDNGPDLGTPVIHRCETVPATGGDEVIHVVLPSRQPFATPLSDLRDAGHDVVSFGVFPGEVPDCPEADGYSECEQVLLRESAARESLQD